MIRARASPTLLQYLLLQWAEKVSPNLKQDPLPLLIELREYARLRHEGNAVGFLEYLHGGASVRWHFDQSATRLMVEGESERRALRWARRSLRSHAAQRSHHRYPSLCG